jgi:hypothetical protein
MFLYSPHYALQIMLQIKEKMVKICDDKIAKKGENVGISFYVFF